MLKGLLVTLLACLATSCGHRPKPSDVVRTINPNDVLFSLPTLCDPGPAVDAAPAPSGARTLHEDDWRQVEFVARTNLAHIHQELARLSAFKQEHRRGGGFTQVYVRKEHPTPFAAVRMQSKRLPSLPTSGLAIRGGPPWGGTVRGGFALSDTGDWFIYGQRTDGHVVHLAVSPGGSVPSEQFAQELSRIAQSTGLLLVDWYGGLLVDTTASEPVLTWARRYERQ